MLSQINVFICKLKQVKFTFYEVRNTPQLECLDKNEL